MSATKPMDIVTMCEQELGYAPRVTAATPLWKARANAAAVLKKAMDKDPNKVSLRNLELAIAFSRRRKIPLTEPIHLVNRIENALIFARATQVVTDLDQRIRDAMDWEIGRRDTKSTGWIARLTRATGPLRAEVLTEWKEDGRG